MSIRIDRPRNAAFNKEAARVQYAAKRLKELRAEGISDEAAWEQIRAELKAGKK